MFNKKLKFANQNSTKTIEEKNQIIEAAAKAYENYLDALGFDWRNDPNSTNTPLRVAKAFVNELACGCYDAPPKATAFDNIEKYDGVVFQGNIDVVSICAHHHLPFIGKAHVAYIASKNGKILGLSKFNRVVDWFCRRPQVQESITQQIHDYLNELVTGNKGIAVAVEANHMCVRCRGVQQDSTMKTSKMSGEFLNDKSLSRQEFYDFIRDLKK